MIDWTKPIEAVHENGRVAAVTLDRNNAQPCDGLYTTVSFEIEPGVTNNWWRSDGKHNWHSSGWRIRNVAEPVPTDRPSDEIVARMVAFVRRCAAHFDGNYFEDHPVYEARAIVAELTEPVDPDIEEAERIANDCADQLPRSLVLAGIKHGRFLNKGAE